jgi:periplasmic protein TonB
MFKELEVPSYGVALTLIGIILAIIGLIIFFRRKYRSTKLEHLVAANQNAKDQFLSSRTKYPELDVFKNSGSFFNFGMASAVALSLVTMSWTTYEDKVFIPEDALVMEEEMEVDIPRTAEPPPPPPPPPPPVIQEVPDTEVVDAPPLPSNDVDKDEAVVAEPVKAAAPPPPPPPPPAPEEKDEIFVRAEQMPRFPGCEDMSGTTEEKAKCAEKKMLEYIYKNLKYPAIARENGVSGQVVLKFVVNKMGEIGEVVVLRDPGAGLGTAASDVVMGMNKLGQKWTPGKQRGRPVSVWYTLPVKFSLQE